MGFRGFLRVWFMVMVGPGGDSKSKKCVVWFTMGMAAFGYIYEARGYKRA